MIFSPKIAKIGKAQNIKIYKKSGSNFVAIISSETTSIKDLSIVGTSYTLSSTKQKFIYKNMEYLGSNLYLAGIDNNYAIVEVNDGI